jgi:hypothetical protein
MSLFLHIVGEPLIQNLLILQNLDKPSCFETYFIEQFL